MLKLSLGSLPAVTNKLADRGAATFGLLIGMTWNRQKPLGGVTLKRVGAKEIVWTKPFRFPLAEGICKQPPTKTSDKSQSRSRARKSRVWDDPPAAGDREQETADEPKEGGQAEGDLVPPAEQQDYWKLTRDLLIRYHVTPRTSLYVPTDEDCPLPVKYLDVMRTTVTDMENQEEAHIEDL